jgi:hypothetical protein
MHEGAAMEMKQFSLRLDPEAVLLIGDIGSYDTLLAHQEIFVHYPWRYIGYDLIGGPGVNSVLPSLYEWRLPQHDVMISGQCLEHVVQPWRWIKEFFSAMKPGGICCIIAPHTFEFHEFPVDCFRYWPDGMRGLFDWAGIREIEIYRTSIDTVAIGHRPGSQCNILFDNKPLGEM